MSSLLEWLQLENRWHRSVRQKKDVWLRPLAQLARALRLTPTAVSCIGLMIGLTSAMVLVFNYWFGLSLLLMSALCDGVDGTLARLTGRASPHGARLDYLSDVTVTLAVFAAVVYRLHEPWWLLGLGVFSLVIGGNQWLGAPLRLAPNRMVLMLCLLLRLPHVGLALVSLYAMVMGGRLVVISARSRKQVQVRR